ncbi:MAG: hypothetical protein HY927_01785 [Elusimicrobia bacterium]|nr:hypothetical protein [Elusimicrobiota bacterium]
MRPIGLAALSCWACLAAGLGLVPIEAGAAPCPASCGPARTPPRGAAKAEAGEAAPAGFLGIDCSGIDRDKIDGLRKEDLLGLLKMSGIWVDKLPPDEYRKALAGFCAYAAKRGQAVFIEIPVSFSSGEIASILGDMAASGCSPRGVSIGNEVDRRVAEGLAKRYSVKDYISDYNRIAPLIKKGLPDAKIVALELSGFLKGNFTKDDPPAVVYEPVFEWLIPFSRARLAKRPDYIAVHYYPFTGSQKEWETLSAGRTFRDIMNDLEPHLSSAPPLIVGEFNATYQFLEAMTYPGSGGDSFMAALVLPAILSAPRVAGLFHWSLMEAAPSTLGLYRAGEPVPAPLFPSYRIMSGVLGHRTAKARSKKASLEAYAYHREGRYKVIAVNTSPFFRRDISFSGEGGGDIVIEEFCGCDGAAGSMTLPPFSINEYEGGLSASGARPSRRYSYADRTVRTGEFSPDERARAYCSTIADFSEQDHDAPHFKNSVYDQNAKIATGGTVVALSSPGGRSALKKAGGSLDVRCALPAAGAGFYRCGVKLPLVTDRLSNRRSGADWSDGYRQGFLRLTIEADPRVPLELHLEDFRPDAVGFNTHRKAVVFQGLQTIDAPIRGFAQAPGTGVARDLAVVLRNAAALRIEARRPGFSGGFRIRKVEVCDRL